MSDNPGQGVDAYVILGAGAIGRLLRVVLYRAIGRQAGTQPRVEAAARVLVSACVRVHVCPRVRSCGAVCMLTKMKLPG